MTCTMRFPKRNTSFSGDVVKFRKLKYIFAFTFSCILIFKSPKIEIQLLKFRNNPELFLEICYGKFDRSINLFYYFFVYSFYLYLLLLRQLSLLYLASIFDSWDNALTHFYEDLNCSSLL